jgi:hypothetical protein
MDVGLHRIDLRSAPSVPLIILSTSVPFIVIVYNVQQLQQIQLACQY